MNSWGAIWVEVLHPASAAGTEGSRALSTSRPAPNTTATSTARIKTGTHGRRRHASGSAASSGSAPTGLRGATLALVTSWSLARGRFGDGLDEAVRGVLASHDRNAETELACGVGRDRAHACDLGIAKHGREPVFGKRPDEVVDGRRAGERDHVDALVVEEAKQRVARLGRALGSVDGKDLDFCTSVRKQ